jgi:hypothetical protein
MAEPLYVLPVKQPEASLLTQGKARQLARNFPCEPQFIGTWVAIQATIGDALRAQWSIVGVGKLAGACLYQGFARDPELVVGQSYKRETGMAGAWGWTFTHMVAIEPIELPRLSPSSGRYDPGMRRRVWEWADDGSGDWWSCCLRELDQVMVGRVREARRKARAR